MERNNNGFTLVELVVVISILGVLIAILAPWYTSKIHKAKVATDWANVKSYYNEIQTTRYSRQRFSVKQFIYHRRFTDI